MATCSSCGKRIRWIKMPSGKKMPLDVEPEPYWCPMPGENLVVQVHGKPAFVCKVPTDKPLVVVNRSHFATCPNAKAHRKGS